MKAEIKSIENSAKGKVQFGEGGAAVMPVTTEIEDGIIIREVFEKWERELCREKGMSMKRMGQR